MKLFTSRSYFPHSDYNFQRYFFLTTDDLRTKTVTKIHSASKRKKQLNDSDEVIDKAALRKAEKNQERTKAKEKEEQFQKSLQELRDLQSNVGLYQ